MNEKEFLKKIKEIKVNVPDEQFFLEYNAVVYNILKENQQLKEKLELSEKARLKCLNKIKTLGKFDGENFTRSFTLWSADFNELAKMLDIDKGEIINEKY